MPRISENWRYALIGGVASIPFTVGLYWQSGMGNELSLNMVFFGGLLGGWLAHGTAAEIDSVGFRAGVIGGLPGLWMAIRFIPEVIEYASPAWLQTAGLLMLVGVITVFLIGASGIVGFIGAQIGNWLAEKAPREAPAVT